MAGIPAATAKTIPLARSTALVLLHRVVDDATEAVQEARFHDAKLALDRAAEIAEAIDRADSPDQF